MTPSLFEDAKKLQLAGDFAGAADGYRAAALVKQVVLSDPFQYQNNQGVDDEK